MPKINLEWALKRNKDVTKKDVLFFNRGVVDYDTYEDFEPYKKEKIKKIISYVVGKYDPEKIELACSQVNGFVIDEKSTYEQIQVRKKILGKEKLSDWDIIVKGVNERVMIDPLIFLEIYPEHWNNVNKIEIYNKKDSYNVGKD